jgi:hypothetical protein
MPGKVTDLTHVKTIVDSVDCRCDAVIALST